MTHFIMQGITAVFRVLAHTRAPARELEFWAEMTSPASSPEPSRPVHALDRIDMRNAGGYTTGDAR